MFYTGRSVGAHELAHFGSVWRVVGSDELRAAALEFAAEIAAKDPVVVRRAKEALNGIDPVDVHRNYRFEQGFTFELNLAGVSEAAQQEFARTESG